MTIFYVLKPEEGIRFGSKWAYADQVDPVCVSEKGTKCPVCNRWVSPLTWEPPHRISLSSAAPDRWGDFVWGAGFDLLVSGRFKSIYESEKLSGITRFSVPVEIVSVGKRKDVPSEIPTYFLIEIVWNGANQDDTASKVVIKKADLDACSYCRTGMKRERQTSIVIEEGSWTGTDIFTTRGAPTRLTASDRFKSVIDTHHLTNVMLIPSEYYAYDIHRPGLWHVRK